MKIKATLHHPDSISSIDGMQRGTHILEDGRHVYYTGCWQRTTTPGSDRNVDLVWIAGDTYVDAEPRIEAFKAGDELGDTILADDAFLEELRAAKEADEEQDFVFRDMTDDEVERWTIAMMGDR